MLLILGTFSFEMPLAFAIVVRFAVVILGINKLLSFGALGDWPSALRIVSSPSRAIPMLPRSMKGDRVAANSDRFLQRADGRVGYVNICFLSARWRRNSRRRCERAR
jgi:hypothetical protein